MKKIFIASLLVICISSPLFAAQSTIVDVDGKACMGDDKSRSQTEQAAITDAKRRAVEFTSTVLKTRTEVKDFAVERDILAAYANAEVKVIQELEKVWYKDAAAGDCYKVTIKAEVIPDEKAMQKAARAKSVTGNPTDPSTGMEVAYKENFALPLPEKPSIAVLPFSNLSSEKELDYFSDGLAEGIINGLSKSDHVFVIARNSTFSYKGKPVKIKQVAEDMGVKYVIEGSVQKEKNRVRITAQLIDALNGRHLFSERYDRDLKDILNLQDEITMKVLTVVQVKLTIGEAARLSEKGTSNLDAYLKVLQAREHKGGTLNKERVERAIQLLEEAIALDPKYAYAYSILSTAYFDLVLIGASGSPRESLQQAVELGNKAISLDGSNSSIRANLAFPYIYLKEYYKAILAAEQAISLSPNSALAYWALGAALGLSGRPQEAISMVKKSLRLSPIPVHSQVLGILANAYWQLDQYEEAIAMYKKMLQIYGPDHLMAHTGLATIYASMGRENEARAEGAEVLRIDPKFSFERWVKGIPYDQDRKGRLADTLRKAGLM